MIRCQECRLQLRDTDKVILDQANGLTHHDCYRGNMSWVQDFSTYYNIRTSYNFFADVKSPSH